MSQINAMRSGHRSLSDDTQLVPVDGQYGNRIICLTGGSREAEFKLYRVLDSSVSRSHGLAHLLHVVNLRNGCADPAKRVHGLGTVVRGVDDHLQKHVAQRCLIERSFAVAVPLHAVKLGIADAAEQVLPLVGNLTKQRPHLSRRLRYWPGRPLRLDLSRGPRQPGNFARQEVLADLPQAAHA